jgi:hypothetical protein
MKSRYVSRTGFVGRLSEERIDGEIHTALKRGECTGKSCLITFTGTNHELWSFDGLTRFITGMMHFQHYKTRVLSVDFDNDQVTDYGYTGHTMATSRYLTEWRYALQRLRAQNMWSLRASANPFAWTRTENHKLRGVAHEAMWQRFRAKAPWVKNIEGVWWFAGRAYSRDLEDEYHDSHSALLGDTGDWRWFTYDWNAQGEWARRFIDADAERRWNKRQAKKAA